MPAEQFSDRGGRPTVRIERRYPHPVEKVWRAVTAPEHLAQWFPSPVEVELRPGGAMRFLAFDGAAATGTVLAVDPPRSLRFTWGEDELTFELTPDGQGTLFTLVHAFDDRAGGASFATGWELCLAGLAAVLAGEPPPPPDRGIARHEELVAAFGLDEPEVSTAEGRWTVRIERQLTCPPAVAWDRWFGTDAGGRQRRAPAVGEPFTPFMAPDVVIGTVTEVEPHRLFAVAVAPTGGPGDEVRLIFTEGTGHGARATLTVTGTDPAERDEAVELWARGAMQHLAAMAASWAMAQPANA